MKKKIQLKLDSRNRVCLSKVSNDLADAFNAYIENGRIILEPLVQIPAAEAWLFMPENKEILKLVKEGLKQKKKIDRGSFAKYLK